MTGKYLYWPVAGAGVFFRQPYSIARAKAALPSLRQKWPDVEIERVLITNVGRRYWRWRDGEWSTDRHYDPTPADLAHWQARSAS